ncbi:MAG: hypothetical protein WD055_04985 [Candidatus Dependentiae bacterium]
MSYYKIYSIFFYSTCTLTSFALNDEAYALKCLTKLNTQCKPLIESIEYQSSLIYFGCETEQEEIVCQNTIGLLENEISMHKFLCWRKLYINLHDFEPGETDPKTFLEKIKDQSKLDQDY